VKRAASHVVDLGPGAGEQGGRVLYAGPGGDALERVDTETARYLRGEKQVTRPVRTPVPGSYAAVAKPKRATRKGAARGRAPAALAVADDGAPHLTIVGATHHNLKDVTVRFPLGRLTAVTGVSGSGKSSLVEEVLFRAACRAIEGTEEEPAGAHREILGIEPLKRVVLVDQSPIGRTPRSCPVTVVGAYAALREVYARQPVALARGLKEGAFSFNTPGGRCENCEGAGVVTVEMVFLADLEVPCDVCGGDRFRREVLEVRYRGLSIRQALDLTVDQAFIHFAGEPRFTRALHILRRVGLGYLRLGQPATRLSGGEAQRLKIARELSGRAAGPALYLMDEPTVGLHFADVQKLLEVLDDLTARGDTVIVVEHNLDLIRNADWVVDLGPDGGDRGGELVAEGTPEAIMASERSWTGRYLRDAQAGVPLARVSGDAPGG
jgi:excinuclease ABC subunit A